VADLAVRVAADSLGGVAMAQLAAAFVVAVVSSELRAVEGCKQAAAAHLPGDGGERILRTGRTMRSVLRRIGRAGASAAISVAHQHAPDPIDGDVVEVEQVAARIGAALVPDAAALDRVRRRRVDGGPGATAVVG